MTDQPKNFGSQQFAMGEMSTADLRTQLLQGKGEAAVIGALSEALDLYSFMSALPDALIASQQREARRLAKTSGEKGPRVEAMRASIAQAEQLNATFKSGRARFDRGVSAAFDSNDVFHGFVSGPNLQMQKGYTVRLMGADGKQRHAAVTQDDGYFSMTIKVNAPEKASPISSKDDTQAAVLGEMLQFFGMRGAPARAPAKSPLGSLNKGPSAKASSAKVAPATGEGKETAALASVEILDPRGEVVQQDPIPVDLDGGTVYREYVVAGAQGDTAPRRYVGNSGQYELHDSQKLTKQCNFDVIRESHKVYFDNTADAEKAGYDYCAYCFGKKFSKR